MDEQRRVFFGDGGDGSLSYEKLIQLDAMRSPAHA